MEQPMRDGLKLPIPEPVPAEPHVPRKCTQRSAHDPHEYSYIDLRKRNIAFGQIFDCPGDQWEAHRQGEASTGRDRIRARLLVHVGRQHRTPYTTGRASDGRIPDP